MTAPPSPTVTFLPQTAFAANGAGVKSSVLFLKKWKLDQTKRLTDAKKNTESKLLKESNYILQRQTWELEIKKKLKEKVETIKNKQRITSTTAKQTEDYKAWNSELLAEYSNKVDELKSQLLEEYEELQKHYLPDYPIFMAIADQIGYDATGKKTAVNELTLIGKELKNFIKSIEQS